MVCFRHREVENKRMSVSPQHHYNDDFSEFIKVANSHNKFEKQRDMNDRFAVSEITHIVFEENDGTEVPFTDLFEYRASIGTGGFGFVVAALDRSTGEEIAIKILNRNHGPQYEDFIVLHYSNLESLSICLRKKQRFKVN